MRAFLLAAFLAVPACVQAPALAHDWYDLACCNHRDCYPIANEDVAVVPGGWRVKATGEVFMARAVGGQRQARWSQDGQYHRCSPNGDRAAKSSICLYVPPGAF